MLRLQLFADDEPMTDAADESAVSVAEYSAQTAGERVPDAGEQEGFEKLIKGQYKEQFDERVHKILNSRLKSLRRENEQLRHEKQLRWEESRRAFADLAGQQEQIQRIYPDFDWQQEVRNPKFGQLIEAGVDARTAYETIHGRELLQQAMAYSARRAARQAAQTVASGHRRAAENGKGGAATTRSDPRTLDSRQLADIRKRVLDGEKIRF